ncbi:hypothetical protein FKW77_002114 [Venturia effusa]|uniref:Uncharacterized protein n=1 Tax=Venturia effusa TaxID=50376 RepID=A0A517KZ56_9PEZI|nr:hypothetical protein FKW77_002114 [Venturia effusa]
MAGGDDPPSRGPTDKSRKPSIFYAQEQTLHGKQTSVSGSDKPIGLNVYALPDVLTDPTQALLAHYRKMQAAATGEKETWKAATEGTFPARPQQDVEQARKADSRDSNLPDWANEDINPVHRAEPQRYQDRLWASRENTSISHPRIETHDGDFRPRGIFDLQHEMAMLRERVLELEGISDARKVIDRSCAKEFRSMAVRLERLERVVFDGGEWVGSGEGVGRTGKGQDVGQRSDVDVDGSTLNSAGIPDPASDITPPRTGHHNPELEDLENKFATLQRHLLPRAWPPQTPTKSPVTPPTTTSFGSISPLQPPIDQEDAESPVQPAFFKAHIKKPLFEANRQYLSSKPQTVPRRVDEPIFEASGQPDAALMFGIPPVFSRCSRVGAFSYGNSEEEGRKDTTHRIDHPPRSQTTRHSHQPTVTEEVDEYFVPAIADLSLSLSTTLSKAQAPLCVDTHPHTPSSSSSSNDDNIPTNSRDGEESSDINQTPAFPHLASPFRYDASKPSTSEQLSTFNMAREAARRDRVVGLGIGGVEPVSGWYTGGIGIGGRADPDGGDEYMRGAFEVSGEGEGGDDFDELRAGPGGSYRRPRVYGTVDLEGEVVVDEDGTSMRFFG